MVKRDDVELIYSQVQNYLPKRVNFTILIKSSKNRVSKTVLHLAPQPG